MKNFAALVLTLLLSLTAQAALAQDIDWLVNMNDTGSDPTQAGGTVTHNISILNAGLDGAPENTFTFDIDEGQITNVTGFSCSPTLPLTGPARITCDIPQLLPDEQRSGTIDVLTFEQGVISGTLAIANSVDVDPSNNVATNTTTITAGSNLEQSISGAQTAASGDIVSYTLTTRNIGPNTAQRASVRLPRTVGFDITSAPACSLSSNVYTCSLPALAAGEETSFDITGKIVAASASTVTLLADVETQNPGDPIPENNTASLDIAITPGSDVYMTKTRTPGTRLLVGDTVSFTLTTRYTGDVPSGLVVRDTLPSNYRALSASGTGWSCDIVGQDISCARPSGTVAGQDVTLPAITIEADIVSVGENVTNTATVTSQSPFDPDLNNNTNSDRGTSIILPTIDLSISKNGPRTGLTTVGSTYPYTLRATNRGTTGFFGTISIDDILPEGMTIETNQTNGWTCPPLPFEGPGTYTCTLDVAQSSPLRPNASTPTLSLGITTTQEGALVNRGRVSSTGNLADDDLGNNTTGVAVSGSQGPVSADVSVVKTTSQNTTLSGDVLTFDIEIVNAGPSTATRVSVEDLVTRLKNNQTGADEGLVGISTRTGLADAVTCSTSPTSTTSVTLDCTIPTLPVCEVGVNCPVISVQTRPGGSQSTRTNTASAYSQDVSDPVFSNNEGSVEYAVSDKTDVDVSVVGAPQPATAGQTVTYVTTARNINNGLSKAESVTVTNTLPDNVFFLSVTPSAGSCVASVSAGEVTQNDTVTCDLGTLMNGSQETITTRVRPSTATRGTTLTNAVSLTTATPETDTTNNQASTQLDVNVPQVNLITNKTESIDPVAIGDTTVYTINVRNGGPSVAENVEILETFPTQRLSYQSHTIEGGTCSPVIPGTIGATMVCTWPTVGVNEVKTLTVTMRGESKGVATNSATAQSNESKAGFETAAEDNTSTETTTVRTRADLAVVSITAPQNIDFRAPFSITTLVENIAQANTAEGDAVVVTGNVGSGVVITGAPTAQITGTTSLNTCQQTGTTTYQCAFGSVARGTQMQISIPSRVVSIDSAAQTYASNASVTTSSLDVNPGNNTNTGTFGVRTSSITGQAFYDFDEDTVFDAGDINLANKQVALSGTAIDGTSVSLTTRTNANGLFTFDLLAEGTYTVSYQGGTEPDATTGSTRSGTSGGVVGQDSVSNIALGANTQATGYGFTRIPTARIGAALQTTGSLTRDQNRFTRVFRITVKNNSLEPVSSIQTTMPLSGAYPKFGTYTTGTPAPGQYTTALRASTCGGINTGFNGDSASVIGSNLTLAPGASCRYDYSVTWAPQSPFPGTPASAQWNIQATIEGVGQLSGQTRATNPQLADLSDNGSNVDSNNNGRSNESGENDPTPVSATLTPSLALVKTADLSALSSPVVAGDIVTYTFSLQNTGTMIVQDTTLTDAMLGGQLVNFGQLNVGQTVTHQHQYTLTAADIARNSVTNSAVASAQATTTGPRVTDTSGTAANNNTPTSFTFGRVGLVKSADTSAFSTPPAPGDTITYTFTVRNLGDVALTNIMLSDPLPGLTLAQSSIARLNAGAEQSLTGTYALTQSDIDTGRVTNSAQVSATWGNDGTDIMVTDTSGTNYNNDTPTRTDIQQVNTVALVKRETDTSVQDPTQIGDTITYGFTVTNTGNTTLTNLRVTDDLDVALTGAPIATLAPGQQDTSYAAIYTVTQADIDAGRVENTARVQAVSPGGDITDVSGTANDNDTPTISPLFQNPEVALIKASDPSALSTPPQAGDTLTYDFTLTNTGNVTLRDLTLSDALDGVRLPAPLARLNPGQSQTVSGTYDLRQAEIDAGTLDNSAQVQARAPLGDTVTDTSGTALDNDTPTTQAFDRAPSVALVKTADTSRLQSPPQAGDTLDYTFSITNTGNVTLSDLAIVEALDVRLDGPLATLAPNQTNTVSGQYILTQSDLDAGQVINTARVEADSPTTPVSDTSGTAIDNDTPTTTPLTQSPALALVKSADTSGFSSPVVVGDEISYAFSVENTGNVTVSNITLTDTLPGITLTGSAFDLAPGEINTTTYTGTYALTQADINAGQVENTALVTGQDTNGQDVSDTSGTNNTNDTPTLASIPQNPSVAVIKTVDGTNVSPAAQVGEIVTYGFTVQNIGNTRLDNVQVSDSLPGIVVSGTPVTLNPGETSTAFTAQYALTQADIDAGRVENSAQASGDIQGTVVTDISGSAFDNDTPTVLALGQDPSLALVKTSDLSQVSDPAQAGDIVTYTFSVENTGNTTVSDITLNDEKVDLTGAAFSLAPGAQNTSVTGNYTLTQADIDAGQIENTATATGQDTNGDPVSDVSGTAADNDTPTRDTLTQSPSVALVKAADVSALSSPARAGDVVTYTFFVENTGNVTLTSSLLSDPMPGLTFDATLGALAPQAQAQITGTYALTQDDIDAGRVENSAQIVSQSSAGETRDTSGTANDNDTPTVTSLQQSSAVALVKTADTSALSTPAQAGDIVTYTFSVQNTGNTTLSNVVVEDLVPQATVTGTPFTLIPGATNASYSAQYALTQADIDAGFVENTAQVRATGPETDVSDISGTAIDNDTPTRTDLDQNDAIALVKTADTSALSSPVQAGDIVSYVFTIENLGNTTLSNVVVTDALASFTSTPISLIPGATQQVRTDYTLTQTDLNAGFVENTAQVTADSPAGTVSDTSGTQADNDTPTSTPLNQTPALTLVKTSNSDALSDAPQVGEIVTYTFVVENTGNVTLTNLDLTDPMIANFNGTLDTLDPAQSATLTGTYALTQDNIDAGFVENTARATGLSPLGVQAQDVSGTQDDNDTPTRTVLNQEPSIALVKTDITTLTTPAQGDELTYRFTATNTGNTTLTALVLTDDLDVTIIGALQDLAPGETSSVEGVYTLTQTDIDAGVLDNTAQVSATAPDATVSDVSGTALDNDTPTRTTFAQSQSLTLVKTADTSALKPAAQAGDIITYSFLVENTGNVTVRDIAITDPLVPVADTLTLTPGQTGTLQGQYALTQDDLDAGRVENSATARGDGANGARAIDVSGTQSDNDTPTVTSLTQSPAIALVKSANTDQLNTPVQVGDIVGYTFLVENTGNVTLTDVTVSDPMPGLTLDGQPVSLIPGAQTTLTGTYALTQDDIDAGLVTNQASVSGDGPNASVTDLSGTALDNDTPTQTVIAQDPIIALVKVADTANLSDPAQVGDEIVYTFTLSNLGNTTLTQVEVQDDLDGLVLSGTPVTLAPGETDASYTATYALTQADLDAGQVENSARTTALAPNSDVITDVSGTELDNDTPTLVVVAQNPQIAVVKTVDESGLTTPAQPGDMLVYAFSIENTGNTTLTDITLEELLEGAQVTGSPVTLAPGETDTSFAAQYILTQSDIDAGQVENSAVVRATGPNGVIEDISGTDLDNDDPVVSELGQNSALTLVKIDDTSAVSDIAQVGEIISYAFSIENTGNTTLTNVTVSELLDGAIVTGTPVTLVPGETNSSFTAQYALTQTDIDAGQVENSAVVRGSGPSGDVEDLSGVTPSDDTPTVSPLGQESGLTLVKTAIVPDTGVAEIGDEIRYTFALENTGNTTLTEVTVTDPMPGVVMTGAALTLAPGEINDTEFEGVYAVTQEDFENAEVINQARVRATTPTGPIEALSGTDTDNTDPTVVTVALPELGLEIVVEDILDTNSDGLVNPGDKIVYGFVVTNLGNVTLNDVTLDKATLSLPLDVTCTPVTLAPGESATLSCDGTVWTLTQEDAQRGSIQLFGQDMGLSQAGIEARGEDDSDVIAVTPTNTITVKATKTANKSEIVAGEQVTYTLTYAFIEDDALATPLQIIDDLPAGFAYTNGTATLNGQSVEVSVRGKSIVFPTRTLTNGATMVAKITATALGSARPGDHVNTTWANGPSRIISNKATASVRIRVEPVFDCSTVIGRVFIDANANTYFDEGEVGVANARLVAPNGLTVYTDRHGRYSIPCGALPGRLGENFQLKLDERTLPGGFNVISENPRVMRLTAGMTSKMNFAVSAPVPVAIDLDARAFVNGQVRPEFNQALQGLAQKLQNTPSRIVFSYQISSESPSLAQRHLNAATQALRHHWVGEKRNLTLETRLK